MTPVYLVQEQLPLDCDQTLRVRGIYRTEDQARAAVLDMDLAGTSRFFISECALDRDELPRLVKVLEPVA